MFECLNVNILISLFSPVYPDGFTPLMAACQSFYADEDKVLSIVELLIKSGAMVDSKDLSSKTALMYACETGKSEVALYLVESGANLSLKDNKHWTVSFDCKLRQYNYTND